MSVEMHQEARGAVPRECAYCMGHFHPRRSWERFCSPRCRADYDMDIGLTGSVTGVRRRAKGGVSVTLYFEGPASDRAVNLLIRDRMRLVKQP